MRNLYKSLILLAVFIIECSIGSAVKILGVAPNILLCAVIAASLTDSDIMKAAMFGLFSGAVYDVLWGRIFGVNALLMMYICILTFIASAYIYRKTVISVVIITFFASVLYEFAFYTVSFVIWEGGNIIYHLFRIIIPCAAYTACLQVIIYPVMNVLSGKDRKKSIDLPQRI